MDTSITSRKLVVIDITPFRNKVRLLLDEEYINSGIVNEFELMKNICCNCVETLLDTAVNYTTSEKRLADLLFDSIPTLSEHNALEITQKLVTELSNFITAHTDVLGSNYTVNPRLEKQDGPYVLISCN